MTQDQERQLIEAFNNVEGLVGEEDFTALIKDVVAVFKGYAGAIDERENDMPRTKGSSNKKKNSTSAEVAPVPTSVAVPPKIATSCY
jgi:hypothetical protein